MEPNPSSGSLSFCAETKMAKIAKRKSTMNKTQRDYGLKSTTGRTNQCVRSLDAGSVTATFEFDFMHTPSMHIPTNYDLIDISSHSIDASLGHPSLVEIAAQNRPFQPHPTVKLENTYTKLNPLAECFTPRVCTTGTLSSAPTYIPTKITKRNSFFHQKVVQNNHNIPNVDSTPRLRPVPTHSTKWQNTRPVAQEWAEEAEDYMRFHPAVHPCSMKKRSCSCINCESAARERAEIRNALFTQPIRTPVTSLQTGMNPQSNVGNCAMPFSSVAVNAVPQVVLGLDSRPAISKSEVNLSIQHSKRRLTSNARMQTGSVSQSNTRICDMPSLSVVVNTVPQAELKKNFRPAVSKPTVNPSNQHPKRRLTSNARMQTTSSFMFRRQCAQLNAANSRQKRQNPVPDTSYEPPAPLERTLRRRSCHLKRKCSEKPTVYLESSQE